MNHVGRVRCVKPLSRITSDVGRSIIRKIEQCCKWAKRPTWLPLTLALMFTPSEYQEQVDLIAWCDTHPDRRLHLIYSHLNGMRTNIGAAKKAKASGARKGIPDLFLPVASRGFNGLYIELKRAKGGSLSPEQKEWMALLKGQGYECVRCNGAEAAKVALLQYLEAS